MFVSFIPVIFANVTFQIYATPNYLFWLDVTFVFSFFLISLPFLNMWIRVGVFCILKNSLISYSVQKSVSHIKWEEPTVYPASPVRKLYFILSYNISIIWTLVKIPNKLYFLLTMILRSIIKKYNVERSIKRATNIKRTLLGWRGGTGWCLNNRNLKSKLYSLK